MGLHQIGHDGGAVGTGGEYAGQTVDGQPADGDQRCISDPPLPTCQPVQTLRRAGVRIGLSTHDDAELERALSFDPAYVALGPVYPTLLKKMPWAPQGLARLTNWKARIGHTPLVAIGGLTIDRLPGVFAAGADSAAVVTNLLQAENPEARTRDWIAATRTA